ncbi:antimicrobial peptide 1-like [Leptopilina heterotoma]|uniref:antimicrobial peptide 1-like n=1 Tax=Leptopilina heterotoma TaxID=63436 RepID=UPI001CA97D84|nr:antimicrobial peptide 1-like [Leptopilina heterotoma]XP_043468974.1 antimicrobial peptide 1-like [Leptopilina heterotoma]
MVNLKLIGLLVMIIKIAILVKLSNAQCIVNGGICKPGMGRVYCCGICQLRPQFDYGICING